MIGQNALYYDDYALSISYFNQVINAKPYLSEPYFYRGLAKFYLEDYHGADQDCSASIERNPFIAKTYQLRGLCRIKLNQYREAIRDYSQVVHFERNNQIAWYNRVLCRIHLKEYARADAELDTMALKWPAYNKVYGLKAQIALEEKDSVKALACIDRSLSIDSTDAEMYAVKGLILLQQRKYAAADTAYTRAIDFKTRDANVYINRALTKYNQKQLRAAMEDYDRALELDETNFLGHYNRGLLRAQVGDDNRAIQDFDFVLEREPDEMLALYNRAVLLERTGDYRGAIRDYSNVLKSYPNFYAGYERRAFCRRKIGDERGAIADERKLYIAQIDEFSGRKTNNSGQNTRKRKERDIRDYQKLVVEESEQDPTYESEFRGKIQNKKAEAERQSLYELVWNDIKEPSQQQVGYFSKLDYWNKENSTLGKLVLSGKSQHLSESQAGLVFEKITSLSKQIENTPTTVSLYLMRAVLYTSIKDYGAAMNDLNKVLQLDSLNMLAYIQRAAVRLHQQNTVNQKLMDGPTSSIHLDRTIRYKASLSDFEKARKFDAKTPYILYNSACLYMDLGDYSTAIAFFTDALAIDAHMGEAYFNRGLCYYKLNMRKEALADLSKAGESGLYAAYSLIKQFSKSE